MARSLVPISLLIAFLSAPSFAAAAELPNIVFLFADDMGYGDPGCYNPESKCPTPHIDRLAREGTRFTDAHAAGALCVQSRYGLLTGQYPFRASMNWGKEPVIGAEQPTIASLLKERGYRTAMVGKWHLGFEHGPNYDFTALRGGPCDRGFDTFFGIPASLDIPPYYYIRDRSAVAAPTEKIEANSSEGWSPIQGAFWRAGGIAPEFRMEEVLDRFTSEAVEYVNGRREQPEPFFLYVAFTGPHTPWLPAEKFSKHDAAGLYSQFVAHVDDCVGRVLAALEETGQAENTLVFFSSDNGPVWYEADAKRTGHRSAGPWRGMKADYWEAGHRMPLIARWPGRVPAGALRDDLVGLVDIPATLVEVAGGRQPAGALDDSISFLPALLGKDHRPARTSMLQHHTGNVIRQGSWKLITQLGSGGFSEPRRESSTADGPSGQLYDLAADPGETTNLWLENPDVVRRLLRERDQLMAVPRR